MAHMNLNLALERAGGNRGLCLSLENGDWNGVVG